MQAGTAGRIVFFRILEHEDLAEAIVKRAEEGGIRSGLFIVIGSLEKAIIGYYRDGKYTYVKLDGPLEIASCSGNIAVDENENTVIHPHIVVSNDEGRAFGGHLMKGSPVGATAELVIIEVEGVDLKRKLDLHTKLNLLNLQ